MGELLGTYNHSREFVCDPVVEKLAPWVEVAFLPSQRRTVVRGDIAERLADFCEGAFTSRRIANESTERWSLSLVKTDVAVLVAQLSRSLGPREEALIEHEWRVLHTHPHGHAWAVGIAELTQLYVDPFLDAMGWFELDDRLREAHLLRHHHVVQAAATRAIVLAAAEITGTTFESELRQIVADGGGQLSV